MFESSTLSFSPLSTFFTSTQRDRSSFQTMAPPIMSFGRTSVVGWSPSSTSLSSSNSTSTSTSPYLATGTVSGALDDSFSSESLLELWQPFNSASSSNNHESLEPIARVNASARFNRIAWGSHGVSTQERPLGIIAGGLENGNVALWDPSIAIHHQGHEYTFSLSFSLSLNSN